MSAHTPGPWHMKPGYGVEVFAGDGDSLMTLDRPLDELGANARLVCAAPDLLNALNALLYEAEAFATSIRPYANSEALAASRAAIAKATGAA